MGGSLRPAQLRFRQDAFRRRGPRVTAARIGQSTCAGMPLGDGLRAVAAGCRVAGPTLLSAGWPTVSRPATTGRRPGVARRADCPALPRLMLAGVRTGRLAEVLEEFVDAGARPRGTPPPRPAVLAYPLVLLVMLAGMAAWPERLPRAVSRTSATTVNTSCTSDKHLPGRVGPAAWILSALAVAAVAVTVVGGWTAGPAWLARVAASDAVGGTAPAAGPLERFSRLMSVLLEHQVPLPEALRLTAAGRVAVSWPGCRRVADEVEAGRPLAESMRERPQFPPSLIPLLEWGQRTPALAAAFRAAAEMYQRLSPSRPRWSNTLLLPITLLLITGFVGIFVSAITVPMPFSRTPPFIFLAKKEDSPNWSRGRRGTAPPWGLRDRSCWESPSWWPSDGLPESVAIMMT